MSDKISCPLCAGASLSLITNKLRFNRSADVYRCLSCGLTFLDQESFKFPAGFYEKEYHQTYLTHVEPAALDPNAYFEKMRRSTKVWADKFSTLLTGNETVLDIGCSTGHFMDLIKAKAGKIYGSELSAKEVEFCRDKLNFDVSSEPLEKRFAPGTFDYITLIYVLEHIAEPQGFLKKIKGFLKPKGKLVILVPNIQDALMSFYDIPEFSAFYYCIEHLFYYSQDTIKLLFDKAGLSGAVEVLQEYPITNHLNWAYRRAPSDTLASRKGLPDVSLKENTDHAGWEVFWEEFNARYREFLRRNGCGDRLWCVVG